MKKILLSFSLLAFLIPSYIGVYRYNYSYYGDVIHSAPGMVYAASFNEETLNSKRSIDNRISIDSPEDLVVYNNFIYLISSKANSLTIVDSNFDLVDSYTSFNLADSYKEKLIAKGITDFSPYTLKEPMGLEVKNAIFICDTGNARIIKLNHDLEVIDAFSEIDEQTFLTIGFSPMKITVDSSERMYVVAKNVYEGIVELDSTGEFNRFTGVNPIKLTPIEIFQRALMSEEQLDKLPKFLPTEYTNVTMNAKNFMFAVAKSSEGSNGSMIQLINPKGKDILKRTGYHDPMGDIQYVEGYNNYVITGPSDLVDVAITNDGIYTVLDSKRSRLFTYDSEGNLLYINGDEGTQSDKFSNEAVALGYLNDNLLVLDRKTRNVIVFQLTEFGSRVNLATHFHEEGEFAEAAVIWEEILRLNTNYEIAYNGIGKNYLREKEYQKALENFNYGHDEYYYSRAYKAYRNQLIKDSFSGIVATIILLIGVYIVIKNRKKLRSLIRRNN